MSDFSTPISATGLASRTTTSYMHTSLAAYHEPNNFSNMPILLYLPLALAATFALYLLYANRRHAHKEKALGCRPAPLFRPWDILGIQNFKIEMNGMTSHRLSHAFSSRKDEMSAKVGRDCKTFRIYYPPGETWYYTFDPRNLQAVLATQFSDFQQPGVRVGAFEALLGLGIVCTPCKSVEFEPRGME